MRHRLALSLALLAFAALPAPARAESVTPRPTEASHPLDSSSLIATTEYPMSTSASGTASQVTEQLDRYVSQFGGSGIHHVAADAARAAVEKITAAESDKATFSISVSETVSDSSGSINVFYSVTRPATASTSQASAAPSQTSGATPNATTAGSSAGSASSTSSTSPDTTGGTQPPAGSAPQS